MNFEEAAELVRELSLYKKTEPNLGHDGADIIAQDATYLKTVLADSRLTKQDRFRQLMSLVTILADIARERFETFAFFGEEESSEKDEMLRRGYEISAEMLAELIEEMRSVSKRL
jgi:hypothetical protein